MSIENVQKITLDFCRNNIQSVSVKQYDKNTRYLIVSCTENGKFVKLDKSYMTCRVKVLTPDDRASLDTCTILDDGTVKVPLKESTLFSSGVANAELMITSSDESKRIGTMKFRVIIDSSVYGDERVISSDEFSALTELFDKADKDYTYITTEAKKSADAAKVSETNAKKSETNAKSSETNAESSASKAKASEEQSAINATASDNSQREALQSVSNARTAEANTISHANEAKMAKDSASDYAKLAQSYANGSSGTRTNEETDNAKYYSDQAKSVSNSIPTYIKQIENAGDSQVSRINEALTNASVNFIVDITTGHLMYEGTNKLNFSVNNNGHLEWEVVSL